MSSLRAYFINALTGEELSNHPANGKPWVGTGGNCHVDGEFIRGTTECVTICQYGDLSQIIGEQRLTAADFDVPVVVKIWAPSSVDWRYLMPQGTKKMTTLDLKRAARCVEKSS